MPLAIDSPEAAPSAVLPPLSMGMRVLRWLRHIREHLALWASLAVTGILLGLVYHQSQPNRYISSSRVILGQRLQVPDNQFVSVDQASDYVNTQIELLRGREMQDRVAKRVLEQFKKELNVEVRIQKTTSPNLLIVEAVGDASDAKLLPQYLTLYLEEFVKFRRDITLQTSESSLALLRDQIKRSEATLRHNQDLLYDFQEQNKIESGSEDNTQAREYLTTLREMLSYLKTKSATIGSPYLDEALEQQRKRIASVKVLKIPALEMDLQNEPTAGTISLNVQYQAAKSERNALAATLRPEHPKMIQLNQRVNQLEGQINSLRKLYTTDLKTSIDLLEKAIGASAVEAGIRERKNAEYGLLKSKVEFERTLYQKLVAGAQNIDASKHVDQEALTIIAPPSEAGLKITRMAVCLLGGLGGGVAAILLGIVIFDVFDDRPVSPEESVTFLPEPCIVLLPRHSATRTLLGGRRLILPKWGASRFAEALRKVRSFLLFSPVEGERPKLIMIGSANRGEGKSVVAAHLAATVASSGARTLLVDADFSGGCLHRYFNVPHAPGFTEILLGEMDWEKLVRPTEFPTLHLITKGGDPLRARDLFLSKPLDQFLDATRERYDFVFFDTTSLLDSDSAPSLAPQLDGVLFITRLSVTRFTPLRTATELLRQRQAGILGWISNAR